MFIPVFHNIFVCAFVSPPSFYVFEILLMIFYDDLYDLVTFPIQDNIFHTVIDCKYIYNSNKIMIINRYSNFIIRLCYRILSITFLCDLYVFVQSDFQFFLNKFGFFPLF